MGAEVIDVLCKAEVADFVDSFVDEDVGGFEISVDYFFLDEFVEAAEDLADDVEDLILFELLAFHHFLEVSVFAELGDDVQAIFGTQYVLELHNVGVVEPLQ